MSPQSPYRMPPETAPHDCTLIAWPTEVRRDALWNRHLEEARAAHARVARAIGAYEPVVLIANPEDTADARTACGRDDRIDVVAEPIDDSWIRDSGPIVVRNERGARRAVHFRFNAWGGKYPHERDATIGSRIARRL